MGGKPVGIALLLFTCVGCHACQNCCDYLPPVADGHYTAPGQRAGSAFGGPIHDPALNELEVLDEQTSVEESHSVQINQTLRELLAIDD